MGAVIYDWLQNLPPLRWDICTNLTVGVRLSPHYQTEVPLLAPQGSQKIIFWLRWRSARVNCGKRGGFVRQEAVSRLRLVDGYVRVY